MPLDHSAPDTYSTSTTTVRLRGTGFSNSSLVVLAGVAFARTIGWIVQELLCRHFSQFKLSLPGLQDDQHPTLQPDFFVSPRDACLTAPVSHRPALPKGDTGILTPVLCHQTSHTTGFDCRAFQELG